MIWSSFSLCLARHQRRKLLKQRCSRIYGKQIRCESRCAIAGNARRELETKSGKKVSTKRNYLSLSEKRNYHERMYYWGAGFIGSNAAAYYLKKGASVTIFDNLSRKGAEKNLSWLKTLGGKT